DLVRTGEASPVELVDAAIARIEALDPQVNAVIHERFEAARAEAASPDLPDGPFRGVPFLLKDLWPTSAGDPFHMGIPGFKAAAYVHPEDANLTKRYREAGFVILGRTNTPELGLVATTEPLAYGPTHNPWSLDHGPGGSSGGSAAAVASGMVPCANASDGGGSIRIPAAMCGLVGLKPSRGRGSMGPLRDEWGVSVQHVVSHSVRDTAAVLDAAWMPFSGDGVIAPAPARPWVDEIGVTEPLRIGILDHALGGVPTHPDCTTAARRGAELCAALGHEVVEAHPAELDRMADHGPLVTTMWAVGAKASLVSLESLLGRPLTEEDVEPGTWALAEWGNSFSALDLAVAQGGMATVRRNLAAWWDEFDLLITPTTAAPPPLLGQLVPTEEEPLRGLIGSTPYATFTAVFNQSGQPAISVPLHRTDDGLPVGTQFVAAYGREDLLVRIAAQLEQEVRWADTRSPLHP
ncbi:MAG TPA: amidase, partial [Acidimicrobiales bacterium]|nr:amidase [Acidimicrobiales bacterium]